MTAYRQILVAVDLTEESAQVLDQARKICCADGKLSLLHVVQPVAGPYLTAFPGTQVTGNETALTEKFRETAEHKLRELAVRVGLDPEDTMVLTGSPGAEIRRYAEQHGHDVIVIGTHGQHGLGLLLGSTANAVLHGAACDVLAVRINTEQ